MLDSKLLFSLAFALPGLKYNINKEGYVIHFFPFYLKCDGS